MKGQHNKLGDNSRTGHHVDPTGAVPSEQTVVALLSPALSPGVLDDPEWHLLVEQRVLVLPEANNQHSVVNAWKEEGFTGREMGLYHHQRCRGTSKGAKHRLCRTALHLHSSRQKLGHF